MAVRDLSAFFDEVLEYPDVPWSRLSDPDDPESRKLTGVTTYKVASPDAKTGLYLSTIAKIGVSAAMGQDVPPSELEKLKLDDDDERGLYEVVLGDTYAQMVADGVPWTLLQHIGQDAYLTFALNEDTANATLIMAASRLGKSRTQPNRAARRAGTRTPKKTAGSKSSRASSGTPARTRNPGSTPSSKPPAVAATG